MVGGLFSGKAGEIPPPLEVPPIHPPEPQIEGALTSKRGATTQRKIPLPKEILITGRGVMPPQREATQILSRLRIVPRGQLLPGPQILPREHEI